MDYLLPKVGICTRDYLLENCTVLLICERELHMHARFLYTFHMDNDLPYFLYSAPVSLAPPPPFKLDQVQNR